MAATAIALLLAEGVVRVFFPHARDHVVPSGLFAIDDELGWRLRPGASGVHRSRYFRVTYAINAIGFRDPERSAAKDPATRRILLLGDSQVFGWGVEEGERFSAGIERREPTLAVWNLGVPGYGLDQQVLAYERQEQLPADEALLFVTESTLSRMRVDRLYRKRKPRFTLDASGALRLERPPAGSATRGELLYRVLSPFHLPYFVERRLAARQRTPRAARDLDPLVRAVIERAAAVARERGQTLGVLAALPAPAAAALARVCADAGVAFLAIEWPADDEAGALVFGEHDAHWNARAHELVAAQVAPWLAARRGRER